MVLCLITTAVSCRSVNKDLDTWQVVRDKYEGRRVRFGETDPERHKRVVIRFLTQFSGVGLRLSQLEYLFGAAKTQLSVGGGTEASVYEYPDGSQVWFFLENGWIAGVHVVNK